MKHALHKSALRGFTLIDVLIAVSLSSFLVILLTVYVQDTLKFSTYIQKHQQIRAESFALVNNTLSSLIREAVSIDYDNTVTGDALDNQLVLYFDKAESEERKITISLEPYDSEEDTSQLKLSWKNSDGDDKVSFLNSPLTVVEDFKVEIPDIPSYNPDLLQQERALQPMVRITLSTRHQYLYTGRDEETYQYYEDPHISYSATYTLRNYSFSNLRN